jgi:uncharacterized membrane protein
MHPLLLSDYGIVHDTVQYFLHERYFSQFDPKGNSGEY